MIGKSDKCLQLSFKKKWKDHICTFLLVCKAYVMNKLLTYVTVALIRTKTLSYSKTRLVIVDFLLLVV